MGIDQLINRYSFVLISVVVLVIAGIIASRRGSTRRTLLVVGGIMLVLLATWAVVHPRETQQPGLAANIERKIGQGTPVLLEFQSPY